MPSETTGIVASNRRVQSVYYQLEIFLSRTEHIAPGQFVMLRVAENSSTLLKRPFSVFKSYPENHKEPSKRGRLVILYKSIGKGTQKMTHLKKGENVELIGPLGNGFRLPSLPSSARSILIGGGVGIASLFALAQTLQPGELHIFLGGRTREDILCTRALSKLTPHIFVATEDGSLGEKGTVIDLFRAEKDRFKEATFYQIYACGPMAMLKALSQEEESKAFRCQASLETRMACGFGACYGCVVKTKDPQTPYRRVCKEGPVFDLDQIDWD